MEMFYKQINARGFGRPEGQGRSKVWESMSDIGALGGPSFVRVHGTEHGPADAQCNAYCALLANATDIKDNSGEDIVDYLASCNVVPKDVRLDCGSVWNYLIPSFVEVRENNEYTAVTGPPDSIAICVGYEIPWEWSCLLQIGAIDGHVDSIYSE